MDLKHIGKLYDEIGDTIMQLIRFLHF